MTVPRWQPLALAAFACLALLLFLGSRGLNEPDEGRYGELAREMAASNDWLIPTLNGIPHFQKPPMIYWATAASIKAFGVNEWAARLPTALAAIGAVALTYAIGTMLYGQRTGVAAGLILLSSMGFFAGARLLTPDMLMTFWITAAIACLVKSGRGGSRVWAWLFFAAMGLGFLTKGPMAFIVPLSAAISWQWSRRRSAEPLHLPWIGGIVLMLAIGLSWFVALSLRNHELFHYFAGDELVKRFGSKAHGRSKPFWFFVWVLPVALFPWTFTLIGLVWEKIRRWRQGWRPQSAAWLLLGWIVIPLVILSLSGSKLPTYVLPLFPALAIALGRWTRTQANHRLWNGALVATLLSLAAMSMSVETIEETSHVDLPDSYMLLPGLAAAYVLMRHHPVTARLIVGTSAIVFWLATVEHMDTLNDQLEQQATVEPIAQHLRSAPDFDRATIFACGVRAHGWEFYLRRLTWVTRKDADIVLPLTPEQKARIIPSARLCEKVMLPKAPAYGLVREETFAKEFTRENWVILEEAGDFLLIGTKGCALQPHGAQEKQGAKKEIASVFERSEMERKHAKCLPTSERNPSEDPPAQRDAE